jgi:hypothetical protein
MISKDEIKKAYRSLTRVDRKQIKDVYVIHLDTKKETFKKKCQ